MIERQVIGIFVEQLALDAGTISRETLLEELNIDSLDAVELVMAFEERFGISIPGADAEKMRTVGDVIDYLSGPGEAGVASKLKRPPEAPGGMA